MLIFMTSTENSRSDNLWKEINLDIWHYLNYPNQFYLYKYKRLTTGYVLFFLLNSPVKHITFFSWSSIERRAKVLSQFKLS